MPCALAKAGFRESGAELQPLPLQGLMFRWGVDFAGPLPESARGKKWILICVEHCTKWVELVALPTKLYPNVAHSFLKNVLSRFGVPSVVLTGQGKESMGEF